MAESEDLLGDQVLTAGGDPSFESCAALLPPLVAYTFLATEPSSRVVGVAPDGRLGALNRRQGEERIDRPLFDPRDHLPPHAPQATRRGLVAGWLPAIDYAFHDPAATLAWSEAAFAHPGTQGAADALVALRVAGEPERCWRIGAEGGLRSIEPAELAACQGELEDHWCDVFRGATAIDVPEPRVVDACRASLARAFITHDGPKPHYGVGVYRNPKDDTFPPATLSTVNACIEWNLLDRARDHIDYTLDHVVRADGTFDYYGPAVSEYGQMLDAIACFALRSGDARWLAERMPAIERIVGHLLRLRRDALAEWPAADPRRGLLFGSPEADTRTETDCYYAGSLWACRGWTEIARACRHLGDDAMRRRADDLAAEHRALLADVETSIGMSAVTGASPHFVPPMPGVRKPFETMTEDRFASYTNYRYWPEMLSSGMLRPEWHDAIIAYRRLRGGEVLGTTRFLDRLDDWPFAGQVHGLLLRDRVAHTLLGFYGHLAAHTMADTFTSYEQVAIRGTPTRSYVADYCVPAQLIVPLMARWLLVFEEPDAEVLWLCRAAPRRWLAPGRRIAVRRATTRWGLVSFAVEADEANRLRATIELPREDFPAEIRLRLRTPVRAPFRRVALNGKPLADGDAAGHVVRILRPAARTLHLDVQLRR